MKRTHARTTNSTGHAIDVCLNEKHDFDSDSNNQKTMEHGQTVKPHLATRTKILGFDTLLGSWLVHRMKDQQPQEQY